MQINIVKENCTLTGSFEKSLIYSLRCIANFTYVWHGIFNLTFAAAKCQTKNTGLVNKHLTSNRTSNTPDFSSHLYWNAEVIPHTRICGSMKWPIIYTAKWFAVYLLPFLVCLNAIYRGNWYVFQEADTKTQYGCQFFFLIFPYMVYIFVSDTPYFFYEITISRVPYCIFSHATQTNNFWSIICWFVHTYKYETMQTRQNIF